MHRRSFILTSAGVIASGVFATAGSAQSTPPAAPQESTAPPKPPALAAEQVKAVVVQSHRSLEKVRELVEATPLLVNACWDWGGGDFETPLEAAAHTGQRAIAEYLLGKGARPSLFAAAMLGQLDLVKAFHAVDPKAHEIAGPHGFTLHHCAKQGGATAQPVLDWLGAQGAAAVAVRPLPYVWPAGPEIKK